MGGGGRYKFYKQTLELYLQHFYINVIFGRYEKFAFQNFGRPLNVELVV